MDQYLKPTTEEHNPVGLWFMLLGLFALTGGLLFGVIGGFQYLYPEFLSGLEFYKTRPLHVSLTVAWIFLAAVGGIYYYLPNHCGLKLFSDKAARVHFFLFLITGLAILYSYLTGRFGGREYWEFPAVLSIPIFVTWVMFGINYFLTARRQRGPWPVYYWMWGTGVVFFFITFSEAYLWLIPYFRDTMVREISVQWKAYGALVGSWNMLVYGTAIFVASRISGDRELPMSKMAFGLYFLGLTNLMFGWAHHIYLLPSAPWIRNVGYIISMTELLILGKIIWTWRGSLTSYQKNKHCYAYRFLFAADIWIFLNLIVALLISVPALNLITHGTHITVAHSMGSTIGINTMILLASVFYVVREEFTEELPAGCAGPVMTGYWLSNVSLLVFFAALVLAGFGEGLLSPTLFPEMPPMVRSFLLLFAISGVGLAVGLWMVLATGIRLIYTIIFGRRRPLPATAV